MPDAYGQPTETSPLIPKNQLQTAPLDPGDGIAPDTGVANGVITENGTTEEDGDGLERQTSAGDRSKQYEGQPEVKKKMKYM